MATTSSAVNRSTMGSTCSVDPREGEQQAQHTALWFRYRRCLLKKPMGSGSETFKRP